ncbi:MAG: hydrogenase nickel incorporation protein HypB [Gammaproteobacteria bacterium]
MCGTCGCGKGKLTIDGHRHAHEQPAEQIHHHDHDHGDAAADLDFGTGPVHAHAPAPGMTQARMVQIEQDILAKNDGYAAQNRRWFAEQDVLALNLVSSPGAGKTTLLTKTITELQGRMPIAVIEGDQQTSRDAERIRATGAPTVQINTGKGCHLDAHMVGHAINRLAMPRGSLLMIENVGNLVCPAAFDLGEAHKVVILSVTEGEDKPLKYPDMFHAADLMVLNKIDLLPHVRFDVEQCIAYARRVHPGIEVLQLSATSFEGMGAWLAWLEGTARTQRERKPRDPEAIFAARQSTGALEPGRRFANR